MRGGDRSRSREDLLGQLRPRRDPGREPGRLRHGRDPVRQRGLPVRGGDRPRARQDLLGRLRAPTRSASGTWTAPAVRRPCSRPGTARAGWRSTRRAGRSTGPTSSPTRSRSGIWTARAPPRTCSAPRREDNPLGVAINPAAGKIYWTDLGSGHGPGREPGRLGHPLDPVRRREPARRRGDRPRGRTRSTGPTSRGTIRVGNLDGTGTASTLFGGESNPLLPALLRSPAGTGAPDDLRRSRDQPGAHLQPGRLGARPARRRSSTGRRTRSPTSGRRTGLDRSSATDPNFTPTEAGSYTCRVTATNQAGSNSQTSAPHTVSAPVAVDDTATVAEDSGATQIDVLANDTGGGPKTIDSVTQPANGSAVITGGGSGLTYQPSPDYCNTDPPAPTDDITYSLNGGSSATVAVTVTCAATNPPSIDSVYPADGAIEVPQGVTYAIFNRAMDKPTAEGAFSLKRSSDGAPVSGASSGTGTRSSSSPTPPWRLGRSTRRASRPPPRTSPATRWRPRRAGSSRRPTRRASTASTRPTARPASPSAVTYAIFNRAMDKPTAEAAFSLSEPATGRR